MRKLLAQGKEHVIHSDGQRILVNEAYWGRTLTDDEGKNWIVRHLPRLSCYAGEYGFMIPFQLLKLPMIFEVPTSSGYAQYQYNPKLQHRIARDGETGFLSVGNLDYIKDAEHIPRARKEPCAAG